MIKENPKIDLICQHNMDGSIIPIKFRVKDEEGMLQEFKIRGYKDTTREGLISFECNVVVNDMEKKITIYTPVLSREGIWYIKLQ